MKIHELVSTTQYDDPTWVGDGFAEDAAQGLWLRLPERLRMIAVEEVHHGNTISSILENRERDIVLLTFKEGPLVSQEADDLLRIHTSHALGDYCYDGTKATYEHVESGCFLAFDDPGYYDTAF